WHVLDEEALAVRPVRIPQESPESALQPASTRAAPSSTAAGSRPDGRVPDRVRLPRRLGCVVVRMWEPPGLSM
ncbi:hypothetical protein ACNFRX_20830, partial [Streptomyces griseoaurantiacus]|uniref:hypothetical protein n=1 Tax=Streptomyces griseoaurantiacus TaxID=68213 RepID=UPI003F1BB797